MSIRPHPEQSEALRALAKARKTGRRRALVVMASGLGKTVVSAFDVKKYLKSSEDTRAFLFLCHQNDILEQAEQTFREILGPKYSFGFLHGGQKDFEPVDGLFASFQSMRDWYEEFDPEEFSYIVVDESHHSHATTYRPVLEYFQPDFLAGYTATPDRADLKDIRSIYGKEVFSLPLEEALLRGLLTRVDYRLMTDEVQNLDVLETPIGKISISELNRRLFIPKRDEEIVWLIADRAREVKRPHTMIFCPSVEHCERLAAMMSGAVAVHHRLSHAVQNERLAAFRSGQVKTVLTVDMFNEGIDIPEANVVVFLRSTASRTIFFQQLGRGLRSAPGKRKVLVLDFVANCERLAMVHELWHYVTTQARKRKRGINQDTISVEIGNIEFDEVAQNVLRMLDAIRSGYTRELMLSQLKALAEELGHVPTSKEVDESPMTASDTYYRRFFGTFNKALVAAGLIPNRERPTYTEEELLDILRDFFDEHGRAPKQRELTARNGLPSFETYRIRFGSLTDANREAGITRDEKYVAYILCD